MATQNHGLGQQPDSRVTEEGKGKKSQARNGVLSIGQTEDPMSQSNAKLQKVVTFLLAFPSVALYTWAEDRRERLFQIVERHIFGA